MHRGTSSTGRAQVVQQLLLACQVTAAALEAAQCVATEEGVSVGRALERAGVAGAETRVARALAESLDTTVLPRNLLVTSDDAPPLPLARCRKWRVLPIELVGKSLRLAMVDPLDFAVIQDVEFATGLKVLPVVVTETNLLAVLDARDTAERHAVRDFDRLAQLEPCGEAEIGDDTSAPILDLDQIARDANLPPVVRLVNVLLSDAARAGASDVHVEPQETFLLVRQRVDGMLHDNLRIPRHLQDAVISRLKVLGGMDISERRRPQDGRSRLRIEGRRLDMRLSTLPAQFGEKVVVRLLDPTSAMRPLDEMGLGVDVLDRFRSLVSRPQGLVLVTGPTGSGKTTTLHAALHEVRSPTKNVVTLEDPIEYRMPGLNQVQVNPRAGVTFASGLRSILRQDPNVVLVGEIRDHETGAIVLEASQTGHMLLSTLHANDAAGSIIRLIDLGLEPFLVASSLSGVLAQRLVRSPCGICAEPRSPSAEIIDALGAAVVFPPGAQFVVAEGCAACLQTGFRGRSGIHELLVVDDVIRDLIASRASDRALREAGRLGGMRSLLEDGIAKAARGLTTLEEVLRVAPLDSVHSAKSPVDHVEARPEAHESVVPAALFAVPAASNITVLIVDDSPVELTVVRYFLEGEGYRVITATDGEKGLLEARRHRPDIIVSDVDMPRMNGLEFVRLLREDQATSAAAIILLTSNSSESAELNGLSMGADDYLTKPINPNRLKARIQAVMARQNHRERVAT